MADEYTDIPQTDDNMTPEAPQKARTPAELLQAYLSMDNIAELGDAAIEANTADADEPLTLRSIGSLVAKEYAVDLASRGEWEERNQTGLDLARQISTGRKYAGETVADVKYPTIASAAIQYASRAYPAIVKEGEVVKYKPVGSDPQGAKAARGMRIAQYMNYAILEDMDNWEDDQDKLLFLQPIVGTYFKKIYKDPRTGKVVSELVWPDDLVLDYLAPDFYKCARKTHVLHMTHNEYLEQVRAGAFVDAELERPGLEADGGMHTFLEQHRTLDLDGDGYEEPYCVTVDEKSQQVLRIKCRFQADGISTNAFGEIARIQPIEYFVEYPFMPSFDGGVYGMGFGILLGPINESINTLFNQLLDAGTRSNFQGGFLGRGLRLLQGGESGNVQFRPGEWKRVAAMGDDLRKSIFPLPANEPSTVLFQLLGFLVQASKELAANSDLLAGIQEQHNVPATSTMALIEQGLKVIGGIYKRMYRALRREYKQIKWYIAQGFTDPSAYLNIIDDQQGTLADWVEQDHDIIPMSTAAEMTEAQMYLKAQAMMSLKGQGLDDMEINKFFMEALGIPNVQRFLLKQPPQPPPQFVVAMRELDIREKELEVKKLEAKSKDALTAAEIRERRDRQLKLRADALKALADAEAAEAGEGDNKTHHRQLLNLLDEIFTKERESEDANRRIADLEARLAIAQQERQQAGGGGQPQPVPQGGRAQ